MKQVLPNPVILTEDDYNLLKPYADKSTDRDEEMSLAHELKRAIIVKRNEFPTDGIKINSRVKVQDMGSLKTFELTIVMPSHADMKQKKISVLSPMGAALIGFKKSDEVTWKVPAGLKHFRILDVENSL